MVSGGCDRQLLVSTSHRWSQMAHSLASGCFAILAWTFAMNGFRSLLLIVRCCS
jgi:hypothetical protein